MTQIEAAKGVERELERLDRWNNTSDFDKTKRDVAKAKLNAYAMILAAHIRNENENNNTNNGVVLH